jgi:hypothetical protein
MAYEPLAAHTMRRLPERRQRVFDRHTVATLAITRGWGLSCLVDDALPQCPCRVFAMPARRGRLRCGNPRREAAPMSSMGRREFVGLLGGGAAAWPVRASGLPSDFWGLPRALSQVRTSRRL